jgi:hypothetical protein
VEGEPQCAGGGPAAVRRRPATSAVENDVPLPWVITSRPLESTSAIQTCAAGAQMSTSGPRQESSQGASALVVPATAMQSGYAAGATTMRGWTTWPAAAMTITFSSRTARSIACSRNSRGAPPRLIEITCTPCAMA